MTLDFPLYYRPFYGPSEPRAKDVPTVLLKNGTLMTGTGTTALQGFDMLLQDGLIAQIGLNLPANGAQVYNLEG